MGNVTTYQLSPVLERLIEAAREGVLEDIAECEAKAKAFAECRQIIPARQLRSDWSIKAERALKSMGAM